METGEPVAQRFQMQKVIDEAKVLFDLRVAGIMPVNEGGTIEFLEEERKIAVQREFLEGLAIFDAELDSTPFGFRRNFPKHFFSPLEESLFFGFALSGGIRGELLVDVCQQCFVGFSRLQRRRCCNRPNYRSSRALPVRTR